MVRIWRISLNYFPTLYLLTSVFISLFFFLPVNNVLQLSTLIVFRYLFLGVITFCSWRIRVENSWNQYYALRVQSEPPRRLCCAITVWQA